MLKAYAVRVNIEPGEFDAIVDPEKQFVDVDAGVGHVEDHVVPIPQTRQKPLRRPRAPK